MQKRSGRARLGSRVFLLERSKLGVLSHQTVTYIPLESLLQQFHCKIKTQFLPQELIQMQTNICEQTESEQIRSHGILSGIPDT